MRKILGQMVLLITVAFCFHASFNDYRFQNAFNIEMFLWTILLLLLSVWTIWYPKPASVLIWIYYLTTAIYRIFLGEGEILLFILWHISFITFISLSIWGAFSKKKQSH